MISKLELIRLFIASGKGSRGFSDSLPCKIRYLRLKNVSMLIRFQHVIWRQARSFEVIQSLAFHRILGRGLCRGHRLSPVSFFVPLWLIWLIIWGVFERDRIRHEVGRIHVFHHRGYAFMCCCDYSLFLRPSACLHHGGLCQILNIAEVLIFASWLRYDDRLETLKRDGFIFGWEHVALKWSFFLGR